MLLPQERIPWILRRLAFRPEVLFRLMEGGHPDRRAVPVSDGRAPVLPPRVSDSDGRAPALPTRVSDSDGRAPALPTPPVYLTFDDGPIPESTPWLLETLERYGAKATFFMVADNARRYPDLFRAVVEAGHAIGNHTFHHRPPFRQSLEEFLADVRLAEEVFRTGELQLSPAASPIRTGELQLSPAASPIRTGELQLSPHTPNPILNSPDSILKTEDLRLKTEDLRLFRPPHGLIRRSQQKALEAEGYRIVMFDLNTLDYRPDRTPDQILASVKAHVRPGSIINLHDSLKSIDKLRICLPHILSFLNAEGYSLDPLNLD